jgi:CASC3/Barentsz eIF4AIII binding
MPPSRRRLAPRRRRADDGEEEGSVVGDVEDDSLSEGSALSVAEEDADAEASDASLDEDRDNTGTSQTRVQKVSSKETVIEKPISFSKESGKLPPVSSSSADQDAMLNGLQASTAVEGVEELHFDDSAVADAEVISDRETAPGPQADAPKAPRNETLAQKSRREHQEYLKERDSNPAFVPNRGGFFLHDDRSSAVPTFSGRPYQRGRGRDIEPAFHGP